VEEQHAHGPPVNRLVQNARATSHLRTRVEVVSNNIKRVLHNHAAALAAVEEQAARAAAAVAAPVAAALRAFGQGLQDILIVVLFQPHAVAGTAGGLAGFVEGQRGHGGDLVGHRVDRGVEVSLGGHPGVRGGWGDRLHRVAGAVVVIIVVAGVENDSGAGRGGGGGNPRSRDGVGAGAGADVAQAAEAHPAHPTATHSHTVGRTRPGAVMVGVGR